MIGMGDTNAVDISHECHRALLQRFGCLSADSEGYAPRLSTNMEMQEEYPLGDEQLQDDHGGICADFDVCAELGVTSAASVSVGPVEDHSALCADFA